MSRSLITRFPRVTVALSAVQFVHREIIAGILRYTSLHTPWVISLAGGRKDEPNPRTFSRANCNAIFTDGSQPELFEIAEARRLPVVTVQCDRESPAVVARVVADHDRLGELAARHFLDGGFTHFAYAGERAGMWWSRARERAFAKWLAEAGHRLEVYTPAKAHRNDDRRELGLWLKARPRPLAVLAANDARAREVLDACREIGLSVPGDIALLGVDNDDLLCETALPTLSSISWSCREAGFQVAEFLDGLLHGQKHPHSAVTINFVGKDLVARKSSLPTATLDPLVVRVRELIDANLSCRLRLCDIAHALHLTEKTLTRRFSAATGHSVHGELMDKRIARARKLMAETNSTLESVALDCGFYDVSHMRRVLKSTTLPPGPHA